jgi:hypothetical protein
VRAADVALASGEVDALVAELTAEVERGVRARFAAAREAQAHAGHGVANGRAFVATYVELTHYVEALEATAAGHAGGHGEPGAHETPHAAQSAEHTHD